MGFSTDHSSSVPLVLNLSTGHISPQCHVAFDERFETVTTDMSVDLSETWIDLWQNAREFFLDEWDIGLDGPCPDLDPDFQHDPEDNPEEQEVESDAEEVKPTNGDDDSVEDEAEFLPAPGVAWCDVEVPPPRTANGQQQPKEPTSPPTSSRRTRKSP